MTFSEASDPRELVVLGSARLHDRPGELGERLRRLGVEVAEDETPSLLVPAWVLVVLLSGDISVRKTFMRSSELFGASVRPMRWSERWICDNDMCGKHYAQKGDR